ncbi:MAG: ShlB/FhaC/HecB family hemolysin secretion/activation protein [Planctomycetota bacterium]|jgi:hemolysin activation/secretion protein
MNYATRMIWLGFVLLCLGATVCVAADQAMADNTVLIKTKVKLKAERKDGVSEVKAKREAEVEQFNLPEDTSSRFTVKELRISGNTLISTYELLENMPVVYNASDKPPREAEPGDLYDFKVLHDIILHPGEPREVSRRTMEGLTQYILSVYQGHNYAGIYVYIAAQAFLGGAKLKDGLLPIQVVEARVSEITVTAYDLEHEEVEKGVLRSSVVEAWSPVKVGQVVNRKKLDDFVNLLNLNPDRYVSPVISRGAEPNSLALGYDIYEANPWHYYIQMDNSGIKERQWAPRIGLINTNLTGRDDRFTAMYQAPWESGIEDNYALFGSYDFPVFTPRLRLNLYAGRSEFDITPEGGPLNFVGRGSFYGGILRYNLFQTGGWFFDVKGSLSRERSKVTPSLFPSLGTDIKMDLWGIGADIYRSGDMSNTSFGFNHIQSMGGSPQSKFWDPATFTGTRRNTDRDFNIYTASAAHSRYLDISKIQRLSGSFRWITSDERLAPAKMTTFGGLYSVRGYEENEIVADGGIFASAQYEFDLIKYYGPKQTDETNRERTKSKKPLLRKLAPLAFVDYGRAKIKDHVPGEKAIQELCSVGLGTAVELGDNFNAAVYYGYPLRSTDDTDKGDGRFSISLIYRF